MAPFAFLFMRTGREGAQNIIHAVLEEESYFKVISRKNEIVNKQLKNSFFLSEWIFLPRFSTCHQRKQKSWRKYGNLCTILGTFWRSYQTKIVENSSLFFASRNKAQFSIMPIAKKTLLLNLLQIISHLNDSNTLRKNIVLYLCNNLLHPKHTLQNCCHHHTDHPWQNAKFHKLKLLKVNIFFKKMYFLTKLEIGFLKLLFHYAPETFKIRS